MDPGTLRQGPRCCGMSKLSRMSPALDGRAVLPDRNICGRYQHCDPEQVAARS